ncbi:MAG: 23S rRNA (uracil-5-)-methyltransferase RumA, partial [Peptostreptococcus anaerobius]|nr:23S rRNA (uracil-5-)-methyltransferase RumA [Peptostreptococcus anaerobius]
RLENEIITVDMFYKREPIFDMFPSTSVDMFPITIGVETVALLSKLDVDKHIDVEIKLDELDLTSAESHSE